MVFQEDSRYLGTLRTLQHMYTGVTSREAVFGEKDIYTGVWNGSSDGQESACSAGFDSWVGKIPWRREWQSTPVFLPREFRGQTMRSQRVGRSWVTDTHMHNQRKGKEGNLRWWRGIFGVHRLRVCGMFGRTHWPLREIHKDEDWDVSKVRLWTTHEMIQLWQVCKFILKAVENPWRLLTKVVM